MTPEIPPCGVRTTHQHRSIFQAGVSMGSALKIQIKACVEGCGGCHTFMARTQRIECEGAVYHVTARGNERQAIFFDDVDRKAPSR